MLLQVIPRPGQRWAEFRRNQLMLGMSARDRLLQMVEARRAQTAAQATPGLFSQAAPTMPGLFGGGVQVNPAAGVPTRDAAGEPAPMLASGQEVGFEEMEALARAQRANVRGGATLAFNLAPEARVEEVGIPGVDLPRTPAEIREEHGQHPKLDLPGRP